MKCDYRNENIYKIPKSGGSFSHSLRFDLTRKDGHKAYEEYEIVHIDNEANKYKLIAGGYSGTAGDAVTGFGKTGNNGQYFSTYDQDDDEFLFKSCAVKCRGGWWY
ncbi:Hypothetical predicted protein [Mytilus galloprovincialis]|uniref:Fibrinogen C-terminal domain-containing protein n=1 Tax=Mytilus galloprovincialis TaxID=29158 RepID=A0A8B6EIP4_MYTGA|nr:Hypothetical predicted protein [Mytilus galloprovincialis]